MSGICGIFELHREFSGRSITGMLESLALPGELGQTAHTGASCALGAARRWDFQRCAVVGDIVVAADADLLSRGDIATALSLSQETVSSTNVAELIARLYLERGEALFELLHGAFSFALWDIQKQKLLLAVDRMGMKVLYRRWEGSRLLFGSRISVIRAAQSASPEPDPRAILQFLVFSGVPAPLSSDRDVDRLSPGTYMRVESGRATEHRYWDLEFPEDGSRAASRWAGELREAMRVAVHRNLEGCTQEETGCYLSGGTDSSSVVAFTSEAFKPAQSFSIAFQESEFNEMDFARTAAARFQTRHFEKFLTAQDACNAIEKIVAYYDEPFANSSAVGSYCCAKLAHENGVTTLLAGDGGDELFGGNQRYERDKYFALYGSLPTWLRRGFIEPIVTRLPLNSGLLSLPRKYVRRATIPNPRRILSYNFFATTPSVEIFQPEFLEQTGVDHLLAIPERHFSRAKTSSELNRILYMDVKMTLADNDLRKVSGTAEIAGINVRYPLLDDRLADLSGRIPSALKLKRFEKRFIFKQAMKGILPDKILYKKKHGFGVPLAQWLLQNPRMSELVRDTLEDSTTRQRGYFRTEFVTRLKQLHTTQPSYYGEIVWYLVALELWHRTHIEKNRKTADVVSG